MSINEVLKLEEQAIESWNQHDVQKFLGYCDDSILIREPGVDQPHRGKQGAREFIDRWIQAFPDFKIKVTNQIAMEDRVAAEIEFTGTNTGPMKMADGSEMPATNKKVTANRGSHFAKVRNGKIVELNAYPDRVGMMTQLGIMHELQA